MNTKTILVIAAVVTTLGGAAGAQTPIQDAARLTSRGWTVIPPWGAHVDTWYSQDGTLPLATAYMRVRLDFVIPAPIGGSLEPEPRMRMMLPYEMSWGRIWWAPILVGGDQGPFSRQVDLVTNEVIEDGYYELQPAPWFPLAEEGY